MGRAKYGADYIRIAATKRGAVLLTMPPAMLAGLGNPSYVAIRHVAGLLTVAPSRFEDGDDSPVRSVVNNHGAAQVSITVLAKRHGVPVCGVRPARLLAGIVYAYTALPESEGA